MSTPRRAPRRSDALSRERIVEAAIEVLDADGEGGLTFRALTTRLSTGAGAIYHYVANKEELLAAATDDVVVDALEGVPLADGPEHAIRAIALGIFDAIVAHPWVGAQLPHNPQPAALRIWTAVGRQLRELGVPAAALANAGAALVNYVFGAAAQFTAGAGESSDDADRRTALEELSTRVLEHDSTPSAIEIAADIRDHDDREQFLAGLEIFLAGIAARSQ